MLHETMTQSERKRGGKYPRVRRFPGICLDAESLGVSRVHLYLVLTRQRRSASLLRRYRKLKGTTR